MEESTSPDAIDAARVPRLSVIVPTLDEADGIDAALESISAGRDVEVVVADGGSRDDTASRASRRGARVVHAPPPRARQMNAGAAATSGDLLVFVHADTILPQDFGDEIRRVLARPGVAAGAFPLELDGTAAGLRWIQAGANWRARRLGLPYGDQAIFLERALFERLGGYRELPILEDLDLIRRARRHGRIAIADRPVRVSARRWDSLGTLRATLLNQAIVAGHLAGVAPGRLARWYDRRGALDRGRPRHPDAR